MLWFFFVLGYNNLDMEEKGRKIFISIVLTITLGLVLGCFSIAFIVGYNPFIPKALLVVEEGQEVYLFAEVNDNYDIYRFRFSNSEHGDVVIDSTQNRLSSYEMTRMGVEVGVEYDITVTYLGVNGEAPSNPSKPMTWTPYVYLQKPQLQYDEQQNRITWQTVANADYYEVYYNYSMSGKVITTEDNFLDLQRIEGGERLIYVIAKSNNTNAYRPSVNSDTLDITVIHNLPSFQSIDFDEETNTLHLTSSEAITAINLYINDQPRAVQNLSPVLQEGVYHYDISLTGFYQSGDTIGVCPLGDGVYNVYTGDILYFQPQAD